MRYLEHLGATGADYVHPGGRQATERLVEALELAPGLAVLDVGCGTGATLVRLVAEGVRVTGVDTLAPMVATARRRLRWLGLARRVEVVEVGRSEPWPFSDGAFDRVSCESVLGFQDAAGLAHLLGETRRVLRVGGLMVANDAVWRAGVDEAAAARLNAECLEEYGLRQASEAPWDVDDWCRVYEEHGFAVRSAADLDELVATAPGGRQGGRGGWRVAVSRILSLAFGLAARVRPAHSAERRAYRRLLFRHERSERLVESRLFVLERRADDAASEGAGRE